jgi:hypothetical protein
VLEGQAIAEFPDFIAAAHFADGRLVPILTDWRLPEGGLYFVTPTARARPAKVSALADYLISELTDARWNSDATIDQGRPQRRKPASTSSCATAREPKMTVVAQFSLDETDP